MSFWHSGPGGSNGADTAAPSVHKYEKSEALAVSLGQGCQGRLSPRFLASVRLERLRDSVHFTGGENKAHWEVCPREHATAPSLQPLLPSLLAVPAPLLMLYPN